MNFVQQTLTRISFINTCLNMIDCREERYRSGPHRDFIDKTESVKARLRAEKASLETIIAEY